MGFRTKIGFLAFVVAAAFGFSSCSTMEVNEDDPASLMKEAEDDISSSRYIMAVDRLKQIKNQHPYSSQATDASLRLADVYFLQDSFLEAAASYEAFGDLHPKHPKIGYAKYRVGLSYFMDIPSVHARDLTSAFKAQDAFREYMELFPKDENFADAQNKLAETRKILAEKEMYVGNFYYRRKAWEAARGRYQKVVNQYSDTPALADAEKRLKDLESKPKEEEDER